MIDQADWWLCLGPRRPLREALGWTLAAIAVAGTATAALAMAMRSEENGQPDALRPVIFLELAPDPPQPAAVVAPDIAPEMPMTEASDPPRPEPEAEADPLPPRPEEPAPMAEPMPAPLPEPPVPPEATASDPPPPPDQTAEAPPDIRPPPRPEPPKAKRERTDAAKAERRPATIATAPPSQAGSAAAAAPPGQIRDQLARWGAQIRARIERHARAARGAEGEVVVKLSVTRDGQLASVALARSSGRPDLDALALRAVKAAGRFPAAPPDLREQGYSFSLPIGFRSAGRP